jgi:dCMP deaminase
MTEENPFRDDTTPIEAYRKSKRDLKRLPLTEEPPRVKATEADIVDMSPRPVEETIRAHLKDLEREQAVRERAANAMTVRIEWDEYGLEMAKSAALRADCTRRKVGAALMAADHSIISVGYNGGAPKGPSCLKGECPRGRLSKEELPGNSAYDTGGGTCVALHAEWNVLLRTDWHKFAGSTLYITHEPCHICAVMIAGTAIERVVYPGENGMMSKTVSMGWLV